MPSRAPVVAVALPTRSRSVSVASPLYSKNCTSPVPPPPVRPFVGEVQAGQLHVLDRQAGGGIAEDGDRIEVEAGEVLLPDGSAWQSRPCC